MKKNILIKDKHFTQVLLFCCLISELLFACKKDKDISIGVNQDTIKSFSLLFGKEDKPSDVVDKFFDAIKNNKKEEMPLYVSEKNLFLILLGYDSIRESILEQQYKIIHEEIENDRSWVTLQSAKDKSIFNFNLIKEDGKWKIAFEFNDEDSSISDNDDEGKIYVDKMYSMFDDLGYELVHEVLKGNTYYGLFHITLKKLMTDNWNDLHEGAYEHDGPSSFLFTDCYIKETDRPRITVTDNNVDFKVNEFGSVNIPNRAKIGDHVYIIIKNFGLRNCSKTKTIYVKKYLFTRDDVIKYFENFILTGEE
jgi:hypothetical protein